MVRESPLRKLCTKTAFGMRASTSWVKSGAYDSGLCVGQALFRMNGGSSPGLQELTGKIFTNTRTTAGPNLCGGRNDREVIPAKQNIRR